MLGAWLVIGMVEIVVLVLGALAFLAIGIIAETNPPLLQQAIKDPSLNQEVAKLGGSFSIAAGVVYFIACGEESND